MSSQKLKRELADHTVFMVQEKGWSGMKNGELLRVAENEFDVWVTADQNIEYQQNLNRFNIAVIVLVAPNNRLETLLPMILKLRKALCLFDLTKLFTLNYSLPLQIRKDQEIA